MRRALVAAGALALALVGTMPDDLAVTLKNETYTLPNGLTVILHEDHRLPQVVIDTWFDVGSKDEAPGRSGFAHLFEHLMFMGTTRVPGNQFDLLMEAQGGSNNASTSTDRTNYYSQGPSSVLPLLLWLDADRLEGLGAAMTKEKLDLQRDVVRNERRQNVENTPYGVTDEIIPEALYPKGHPYAHSVIGSHEDLEAATLQDVKDFFATYYVPGNAVLVVAGDFDSAKVKDVIAKTFGAVPARPMPVHGVAEPVRLEREIKRMALDEVEFPRLYLVWPAPAAFGPGSAELDLLSSILGGGASSRLEQRLVLETQIAQDVMVYLDERELGSEFHVIVTAAPGGDLERIKREVLAVIDDIRQKGVTAAELQRVKTQTESQRLRFLENLQRRALLMNMYHRYLGTADGLEKDLGRYRAATEAGLRDWANRVLGEGRLDLRVLPKGEAAPAASLDQRPAAFPEARFEAPVPQEIKLANGIEVRVVPQKGTGLFSAHLVVDGGERAVAADKAGLAMLAASLVTSGAGGKTAPEFAQAIESLGADIGAHATRDAFQVSVRGLAGKLEPTLDLFADAVLRPNLAESDFARETKLALARIRARADEPRELAGIIAGATLYGRDHYRGRPMGGWLETVQKLSLADVKAAFPRLVHPARARFVVVGDVDPAALKAALDKRFGSWKSTAEPAPPAPAPLVEAKGRIVLVERPGAPQTMIVALAPIPVPDDAARARRAALNTLFGGSFTSRLNQNLREKHGFTYGAGSRIAEEGPQPYVRVATSVQTKVTGRALGEIKKEFAALAGGNVSADELRKAVTSTRSDFVEAVSTTSSLGAVLADFAANGRPADALARLTAGLEQVDLAQANATAKSGLFDWNRLLIVLVGDRKAVTEQLAAAGFPAPEIVGVDARPAK